FNCSSAYPAHQHSRSACNNSWRIWLCYLPCDCYVGYPLLPSSPHGQPAAPSRPAETQHPLPPIPMYFRISTVEQPQKIRSVIKYGFQSSVFVTGRNKINTLHKLSLRCALLLNTAFRFLIPQCMADVILGLL